MSWPFQSASLTYGKRNILIGIDDTGLKAYWKFNEASGDIINVSQSASKLTGADLQVTGATHDEAGNGNFSASMLFDGVNDYVTADSSLSNFKYLHLADAKWSINLWIKFLTSDSEDIIFSSTTGSTAASGVWLYKSTSSDLFLSAMTRSVGSSYVITNGSTGGAITDNNWHMLTQTCDLTLGSNNMEIFIDGVGGNYLTKTANAPSSDDCNLPFTMMGNVAGVAGPTHANLMEVSAWSRVLTSVEITNLYNAGSGLEIYS